MRYLLSVFLVFSFSFAKYDVIYNGMKLGEISNFETIKKDYLEIDVTSNLAKLISAKDKFIVYNEKYNGKFEKSNDIKFKKDKYQILKIINLAITQKIDYKKIIIDKDKYIEVLFDGDYYFKYTSKNKIKSEGYIKVENSTLISLIDIKNNIKIIKS